MKLSIVIPVLESYEIVKRQIFWLDRFFPEDAELILVDDGSDPPIMPFLTKTLNEKNVHWIKFVCTDDKSQWSEHVASNIGVLKAKGEYILKTDIDHILTKKAIDLGMKYDIPNLMTFFKRKEGKLDEDGNLIDLGIPRNSHANTYILKREHFINAGGYNEYGKGIGCGGSYDFKERLKWFGIGETVSNKLVYVWPNSPIKPTKEQHLFHNLRKTL